MKTQIISSPLSDGSVVHNLRITDDAGNSIEFACIDFLKAREFEIGLSNLIEANTVEKIAR